MSSQTTHGFGPSHTVLRGLAALAFRSFWHRVEVVASDGLGEPEDLVPQEGTPMIVVANHWNSAADVAVLSIWFPHYRKLHYWAKSGLFAPGLPRYLLLDAGNIPVDRTNKDNQKLFAASFDALKCGEAIAVFPEGGSETVPSLPSLKDGASWAALEYAANIRSPSSCSLLSDGSPSPNPSPQDVIICVAGIAYSDKTKYRSSAVMEFGPRIDVGEYADEFVAAAGEGDEDGRKRAVKRLTKRIADEMRKVTVNAPDWESRNAANMARKILWPDDRKLPLKHLREIDQALIDLFAAPSISPSLRRTKDLLNQYRESLQSTALTHLSLSSLPLPATLDPSLPHPTPTRMRVLGSLILSTLSCLIRLPFFLLPLLVHLPVYLFARYASSGALEEDQAQNKVAVGLVFALGTYATFFAVSCALLWTSIPWGGALLVALVGTVVFAVYHTRLVDDNYRNFQRLLALWTVLIGLWSPIAHSEAHNFLHSVHPRLSLSDLPRGDVDASDVPYTDAEEEEDERGRLLGRSTTEEEDRAEEGGGARRKAPLPSPALFSEQDHLLGNFPHSTPSSSRQPSHDRRPSRHVIDVAPAEGVEGERPSNLQARRRQSRGMLRSRSRARDIRALLALRVETVAALHTLLFGRSLSSSSAHLSRSSSLDGGGSTAEEQGEEVEDYELEAVLDLSASQAGGDGPLEVRDAEAEVRKRAREVGRRVRGWGWKSPKGAGGGGGVKLG
ncbi:hypothetical protein JCM8547_000646 [Rhodosporidiobolus lusitaniae]